MIEPSMIRFIAMPVVGVALGIRDGRLDAKAGVKPLEYKISAYLRATAIPFIVMSTVNILAQVAGPNPVSLLEAIGMAGLCVGLLYTLSRNVTNQLLSRRAVGRVEKAASYGGPRFVLALYCIAGAVAILFVARGSSDVTTRFGHVTGSIHQIAPQIPSQVVEVLAQDNQLVTKGDVLVRLDPRRFKAALSLADGALARMKAVKQVAEAKLAQLDFQKKQIAKAYEENPGAVSLNRLELSKNLYEAGVAAVAQADAAVSAAEAQVAQARLNLSYCTIAAPEDGYISHRSVEVGNFVKPQQPLMAITSSDNVYVMAKFREPDIARIQVGQEVELELAAYPEQPLKGVVDTLDPGTVGAQSLFPPNQATGQFVKYIQRVPVKIVFEDGQMLPAQPLILGLNATCTIIDPPPSERTFN